MISDTIVKVYSIDDIDIRVCFDASKISEAPKDLSDKDKETIRNIIKGIRIKKDGIKS